MSTSSFQVKRLGNQEHRFIRIAPKEVCKDMQHLETFLQGILSEGGEGIILRAPWSPYEAGRSTGFLKHKVTHSPEPLRCENTNVYRRNLETGRRLLQDVSAQRNGSATCKSSLLVSFPLSNLWLKLMCRPNGVTFRASPGVSSVTKEGRGLAVGDIVSFKHSGYLLGSKKPKVPVIFRVRDDLTWDDVVRSFEEKKPLSSSMKGTYSI